MTFELVTTADGSLSCLDSETGQLCHNRVGAYTEALKNYIEPSRLVQKALNQGKIRLLDACYGMGYNTWTLINELYRQGQATQKPIALQVTAIERSAEILAFLPRVLEHPTFDALKNEIGPLEHNTYYRTQQCAYDTKGGGVESRVYAINVADWLRITLEILLGDLRQEVLQLAPGYDAVFHDPFSPQKMPELWTMDLFNAYYDLLVPRQGCLLTYSAAAAVRGGLQEAGFEIRKTQALGQKQGGTIGFSAKAPPDRPEVSPLSETEQAYLQTRAGLPYRDPGLSGSREEILARREQAQTQSDRPAGNRIRKLL